MQTLSKLASKLLQDHRVAKQKVFDEREALANAKDKVTYAIEAQEIAQQVAQRVQQNVNKNLASVVTRCLHTVYGPKYSFKINFEKKGKATWARMVFLMGKEEINPRTAAGGGVVDVAAFALRLISLILSQPRRRKLLVYDEPFKNVNGEEYQARMSGMIDGLASLGVQLIIVTDDDWLKIGKNIEVGRK